MSVNYLDATADLLALARSVLRDRVMPEVPAATRFETAMIANALAIVAREIVQGPAARAAEHEKLARFLDVPGASLPALRARLCHELRAGRLGPEREAELRALLAANVKARLVISNPDYPFEAG